MKTITSLFLALFLVGCASNPPPPPAPKESIHVGMTKAEVLKVLGHEPKRIYSSPGGEVWHYDNAELALIPFNFGFRPEFMDYTFDASGILLDFRTSVPR